jgi:hypothetical protein
VAVSDAFDAGLDHFLEAAEARLDRRVDQSPGDRDPEAGGRQASPSIPPDHRCTMAFPHINITYY